MFDKLIEVLLQFVNLFQCFTYVRQYESGVVLRCGRFQRLLKPGFNWLVPCAVEEAVSTVFVPEPMLIGPLSLTTKDGKKVTVCALFLLTVEDVMKFLLEFEGGNIGAMMILHGILARFIERKTLAELCAPLEDEDAKSASHQLDIVARRIGKKYGFGIEDAQITELIECRALRLYGNDSTVKAIK